MGSPEHVRFSWLYCIGEGYLGWLGGVIEGVTWYLAGFFWLLEDISCLIWSSQQYSKRRANCLKRKAIFWSFSCVTPTPVSLPPPSSQATLESFLMMMYGACCDAYFFVISGTFVLKPYLDLLTFPYCLSQLTHIPGHSTSVSLFSHPNHGPLGPPPLSRLHHPPFQ